MLFVSITHYLAFSLTHSSHFQCYLWLPVVKMTYDFVVRFNGGGREKSSLIKVDKKSDLLSKAKEKLSVVGKCSLEWYFEPCDAYVSVDSEADIPDGGRMRLILDDPHELPSTSLGPADGRSVFGTSYFCTRSLMFM